MENKPSENNYRGFKYIVLLLFVVAVIGFAYFTKDNQQTTDRRASSGEAASSIAADAEQHSKNLMDKAGEIKAGIGDTLTKSREKITVATADAGDKAGEMAHAASAAGSDLAERAQSALATGNDAAKEGASLSTEFADKMNAAAHDGSAGVNDAMTDAIRSMNEDSSQSVTTVTADSAIDQASGIISAQTGTPSSGDMTPKMAAVSNEATGTISNALSEEPAGEQAPPTTQPATGVSETRTPRQVPEDTAAQMDTNTDGAVALQRNATGSSAQCSGEPPMGQDLGDRYIVAVCETMSIISERAGVDVEDLKSHNPHVTNPDLIFPRQRLWLPPRS